VPRSGFTSLTASAESLDLAFVDYMGATLYRSSIPQRPRAEKEAA